MIKNGGRIVLSDGSVLTCEAEWDDEFVRTGLFAGLPIRISYFHNGTPVSLEGARYLARTIGTERMT